MRLNHGLHLAYCTNIHRGETWRETFDSLQSHTLAVRERVCPQKPFAIGLRLSNRAARELSEPDILLAFQRWLAQKNCYVFTINGFPYGQFHGIRVKEQAYLPDWTSPERLAYTNLLFDLLAKLLPAGVSGSVSTLPGSFKGFHLHPDALKTARNNLWYCVEHIARLSEATGRKLHLGLEPEPLCLLESSGETIRLFDRLRIEHPRDPRLAEHLGVNYDACHFAVNFEEPQNALLCLQQHGIKISKLHLSSALKVHPAAETREALKTCTRWSCAIRSAAGASIMTCPTRWPIRMPGARLRTGSCPNGGFIFTFRCTPPTLLHLKPPVITCSPCWTCSRIIRPFARIWKWKPTPGRSCRRN
jgi:hypothetical protein